MEKLRDNLGMDKEDKEILLHISETLDKILKVLSKSPSLIARVFEIGAAVVSVLGIITIIEVILNWLGG